MAAGVRNSIVVTACLAAVVLGACGEHGDGSAAAPSADSTSTASAAPGDVRLFVEEGATQEEATCLAIALGEQTGGDERAGGVEEIVDDFMEAAEGCVGESRRAELAAAIEARVTEELENVIGPLREEFAAQFEAAGATAEEAECMASTLLSLDPEDLPLYGTTAKKAEIAVSVFREHARACASPPRLAELARAWVMGPQAERLAEAGATPAEVRCFVTKVGELDLFLPSQDFNGPRSAEMGADRIVEQMGNCLPEPRVREIVGRAFRNYIEGCAKTSEDPLAPYDC